MRMRICHLSILLAITHLTDESGVKIEPHVTVCGPAIIGAHVVLRHGAHLRGSVVLGDFGVIGAELK